MYDYMPTVYDMTKEGKSFNFLFYFIQGLVFLSLTRELQAENSSLTLAKQENRRTERSFMKEREEIERQKRPYRRKGLLPAPLRVNYHLSYKQKST